MLGKGLRGLAAEHAMKVDRGIAYGNIGGYTMTLSEGMGTKTLGVSARFPDQNAKNAFVANFADKQFKTKYRITDASQSNIALSVVFHDNTGSAKRVREFVDLLSNKLKELGAEGADHCALCHQYAPGGNSVVKINDVVHNVHPGCAATAEREAEETKAVQSVQQNFLGRGTLGAIVGSLLGTIPWIIAFYFGWFVGWLGLLIGAAARKGYELAGGKPCKAKLWIILVTTLLCVIVGNFIGYGVAWVVLIANGELAISYSDLPLVLLDMATDGEFWLASLGDIAMGFLFAFLGIFGIIRELRAEQRDIVPKVERMGY